MVSDAKMDVPALLQAARDAGVMIATAESCTGGMVAVALTDIPGSSDVVERGFVTYTNRAKQEMLGVKAATLDAVGAVSEEVAQEMAEGALAHAPVQLTVSRVLRRPQQLLFCRSWCRTRATIGSLWPGMFSS